MESCDSCAISWIHQAPCINKVPCDTESGRPVFPPKGAQFDERERATTLSRSDHPIRLK